MKKIISVVLAVLTVLSCLSVIGYAKTDIVVPCCVNVSDDCKDIIVVESLSGENYVIPGESYKFTVSAINGYVLGKTTVIKVANVNLPVDVIMGKETEFAYIITPDRDGVYTIENVQEDLYVYAANIQTETLSTVMDFVYGILKFFKDILQWFFGV